jgi:hypothetical protein
VRIVVADDSPEVVAVVVEDISGVLAVVV